MANKNPRNIAYIDGSFNPETRHYGCGGFLYDQHGKKHIIQDRGMNPDYAKMRNVAGELLGAMKAIKIASNLGMRTLTIFYDYLGVEKWATGEWSTKKLGTREYKDFVTRHVKKGLKLYFKHVKGHSGNEYNDEADQLAKLAVGLGGTISRGKKNKVVYYDE